MRTSIKAQVTPEVLAWARDSMGFEIAEIAEKLKQTSVTPAVIEAWEEGYANPTYAQLEKLAGFYKRPIAMFFFPSPPEELALREKFRSLPDRFSQLLPPRMRYLVRKALAKQINLSEIYGEGVPPDIKSFRNKIENIPRNNVTELAAAMREIIDISPQDQFSWKTEKSALKQWRKKLEGVGIWIFKDAFKDDDYCGFFLHDENFPVIYLNNSKPPVRQIFTLFHELGHLLVDKGGVDFGSNIENKFQGSYRKEEVFCNAFASSFLVPDDDFAINATPNDQQISAYAEKYKVSREVILRKCLNRGLVTQEIYNSKVREWYESLVHDKQKKKNNKEGGNPYASQIVYLGDKYLTLLFKQYYEDRIDRYKLADYLGIKVGSVESIEGRMLGAKK